MGPLDAGKGKEGFLSGAPEGVWLCPLLGFKLLASTTMRGLSFVVLNHQVNDNFYNSPMKLIQADCKCSIKVISATPEF
jgi:hypothetical protein